MVTEQTSEVRQSQDGFSWGPLLWMSGWCFLLVLERKVFRVGGSLLAIAIGLGGFVTFAFYALKTLWSAIKLRPARTISTAAACALAVVLFSHRLALFTAVDAAKLQIVPDRFAHCIESAREWKAGSFFAVCERHDDDGGAYGDIIAYDSSDEIGATSYSVDWRSAIAQVEPFGQCGFTAKPIGRHFFSVDFSCDRGSPLVVGRPGAPP
jgi:hypothetical protein